MASAAVTVASLETELAGLFAGIAIMLNDCYVEGSGSRMLGLPEDGVTAISVGLVNVRSTPIGKMLPVWHAYAYEGVVSAGFDSTRWELADSPLERLNDMLGLLRPEDGYFEDCLLSAGVTDAHQTQGHLSDLVKRTEARMALDAGYTLRLEQLALLADMNERSVRNALSAEGESRLQADEAGEVANEDAVRWLAGRRNFKVTQRRSLVDELGAPPDSLFAVEIPRFVDLRLREVAKPWEYEHLYTGKFDPLMLEASRRCALTPERVIAATNLPLSILPQECAALARLLEVEPVWFTYQVMTALFPDQMDMLLNPAAWAPAAAVAHPSESPPQSVVVELTEAMLKHGYLDIPIASKDLFPDCDFGSKGTGYEGTQVELLFGGHRALTDIRMKSAKTLAPRKRFNAWFNAELRAKPGDRIRIDKSGDAVFTLTYIPT